MHGVGNDALAGMEGVGAFGREWLVWIAVRDGPGFRGANFEGREIFNGAGPRELGIVESGVVANGRGEK